jgi:hypothetical protein
MVLTTKRMSFSAEADGWRNTPGVKRGVQSRASDRTLLMTSVPNRLLDVVPAVSRASVV